MIANQLYPVVGTKATNSITPKSAIPAMRSRRAVDLFLFSRNSVWRRETAVRWVFDDIHAR